MNAHLNPGCSHSPLQPQDHLCLAGVTAAITAQQSAQYLRQNLQVELYMMWARCVLSSVGFVSVVLWGSGSLWLVLLRQVRCVALLFPLSLLLSAFAGQAVLLAVPLPGVPMLVCRVF